MDIQTQQFLAAQLRKPEGEHGINVALQMNDGNAGINRLAISQLELKDGDSVLELGMGNGFFVAELLQQKENLKYTGCDYAELMVAEAEKINAASIAAGKASFHTATADKLPFEDNAFDKVMGVNIIYFWEQPAVELVEIKRVLKPGGTLTLGIRPKEVMDTMPFTQFGFTKYSERELAALLEANGYTVQNAFEQIEAEKEFNGITMKMSSLVMTASVK